MSLATLPSNLTLLRLLQLSSSALPVGAYSYSEGLEALVEAGTITDGLRLRHWLEWELQQGSIRVETAVMLRSHRAALAGDLAGMVYWNHWLSAARETEELRNQSWQMGRSLLRLLQDTHLTSETAEQAPHKLIELAALQAACGSTCNFATAFALATADWQLEESLATLGYLSSWATNLVGAGVRLIPLGQTIGQQLILDLHSCLDRVTQEILIVDDDDLASCSWGLALASMAHETQYSRLFRS